MTRPTPAATPGGPRRARVTRPVAPFVLATLLVVTASACSEQSAAEAEVPRTSGPTTPAPAPAPASSSAAPVADEPSSAVPAAGSLLDGTHQVDLGTYDGRWVVPTVEGGIALVGAPADAEVPSTWVVTPVAEGSGEHLLVTVATTDGRPSCLALVDAETVALATCDPGSSAQLLRVVPLDGPDQVGIGGSLGSVVSTTGGRLAVAPDPSEPSSVFTLVDRGVSTAS